MRVHTPYPSVRMPMVRWRQHVRVYSILFTLFVCTASCKSLSCDVYEPLCSQAIPRDRRTGRFPVTITSFTLWTLRDCNNYSSNSKTATANSNNNSKMVRARKWTRPSRRWPTSPRCSRCSWPWLVSWASRWCSSAR